MPARTLRCRIRHVALFSVIVTIEACGGSPAAPDAPTAPTPTPGASSLTARLAVSIDTLGSSVAIPGLSQVQFDASTSSGPGALQYSIDYGDGTSAAQPVSRHVYRAAGIFQATATVTAAGHRASVSQTVTVRAVQGSWLAVGFNDVRAKVEVRRLALTAQDGLSVRGEFAEADRQPTPVTGTLSGERALMLSIPGEPVVTGTVPDAVFDDQAVLSLSGFGSTSGPLAFRPIVGEPVGPPPTAKLAVHIDGGTTTAILGYSPVRFSATGSQGTALSYFLEFGDGAWIGESSATHACQGLRGPGATVTVVDRFGRFASAQAHYSCVGLVHFYGWVAPAVDPDNGEPTHMKLKFETQTGAAVTGSFLDQRRTWSRFTGTLSGAHSLTIVVEGGIEFTGEVLLNDNVDGGYAFGQRHLVLRKKGGLDDGKTFDFFYYDPF